MRVSCLNDELRLFSGDIVVEKDTGSIGDGVFGLRIEIVLVIGGGNGIILFIDGNYDAYFFCPEGLEGGRVALDGVVVDVSGLDFYGLFEVEEFHGDIGMIFEPLAE